MELNRSQDVLASVNPLITCESFNSAKKKKKKHEMLMMRYTFANRCLLA